MATDIFLYGGQANPNDIKLTDPTTLAGGVTFHGDASAVFLVTAAAAAGREIFGDEFGGVDYPGGEAVATFVATAPAASGREVFHGPAAASFSVTVPAQAGREVFRGDAAANLVTVPAAAGREVFHGGATATFSVEIPAAAGREVFHGGATASFVVSAASGSGIPIVRGLLSVLFQTVAPSVTAREVFRGAGVGTFSTAAASGSGSTPFSSADVVFAVTGASGSGTVTAAAVDNDSRGWATVVRHGQAKPLRLVARGQVMRTQTYGDAAAIAAPLAGRGTLGVVTATGVAEQPQVRVRPATASLGHTAASAGASVVPIGHHAHARTRGQAGTYAGAGASVKGMRGLATIGRAGAAAGLDQEVLEFEEILFLLEVA